MKPATHEPFFKKDPVMGFVINPRYAQETPTAVNSKDVGSEQGEKEGSHTYLNRNASSLNPCTVELYPKQVELVQKIRQAFGKGAVRVCTQASTGFGKSIALGYICRGFIEKAIAKGSKEKVVIAVDSLTLIDQLINTLENMFGLNVGVIQAFNDRFNLDAQVQIATPQTLGRRFEDERWGDLYRNFNVGMLLVDECHLTYAATIKAMENWGCKVIGFTATPYAKGMGKVYDSLVKADPLSKLIEDGDLAQYRAFSHATPDLSKCKTGQNGDIQADDKYDDSLIGDVLETWRSGWSDRLTIGFATTIAKSEKFAQLFRENGINAVSVHSKMTPEEATEIISDFKSGKIRVLWSVAKLVKGFDVPECSCLIDCQPTRSLMRHVQKGGRVLRKHPDKKFAVILDHAGNITRNGLYEDIAVDELSTGERGEDNKDRASKEPRLIKCPNCKVEMKPAKVCKACGHEMKPAIQKIADDDIDWVEGDLVEVNKAASRRNKKTSWGEKAEFAGGLRHIQFAKGYKEGWFAHKYKERFGVWPNDSRVKNAKPVVPSKDVLNFMKHQAIKNAKRGAA